MSDLEILSALKSLGVAVKEVKNREVSCLCPLHKDKTPSFFFNLDTERFNCFAGCLKGRGLHQLAFQLNKVLDPLADIPLNHFKRIQEFEKLPTIPNLPSAIGTRGEEYLNKRKISLDSIYKWNIMFWAEMESIVIPIEEVGYIRRSIVDKTYKTLPGTKIGSTLYGLSQFNALLGSAILVEGSLDCIYMHQIGFTNTLAILHSDITPMQYKILQGITNKIYIMLDGDAPGQAASEKIKQRLKRNFIVKQLKLPVGKDPDDLTRAEILKLISGV